MPKKTVLVIPDLHYPFAHQDHLHFLRSVKRKYKPTDVVCLGDEVDFHALSNYEHDPDGYSPGHELEAAKIALKPLYKEFPEVQVCTSNHTSRPFRKALQYGLPKDLLRSYAEFLDAPPGWSWAERLELDNVLYEHGEPHLGKNAALSAALANMQSTVIGHVHSFAGIQYSANPKHLIFGFNAGCLIDKDKYAFGYGAKLKTKPILGCGVVVKGVPTFIPMLLNKHGRWKKGAI